MKISKSRFKQIIQEEMASLAEVEVEDPARVQAWARGLEAENRKERARLRAAQHAQRTSEAEYRPVGEAEYASIVIAFKNILDGFLKDDFPTKYDFYGELKSIADYAMDHRDRWEDAAPGREEHASELGDRIAASQEERGLTKE